MLGTPENSFTTAPTIDPKRHAKRPNTERTAGPRRKPERSAPLAAADTRPRLQKARKIVKVDKTCNFSSRPKTQSKRQNNQNDKVDSGPSKLAPPAAA